MDFQEQFLRLSTSQCLGLKAIFYKISILCVDFVWNWTSVVFLDWDVNEISKSISRIEYFPLLNSLGWKWFSTTFPYFVLICCKIEICDLSWLKMNFQNDFLGLYNSQCLGLKTIFNKNSTLLCWCGVKLNICNLSWLRLKFSSQFSRIAYYFSMAWVEDDFQKNFCTLCWFGVKFKMCDHSWFKMNLQDTFLELNVSQWLGLKAVFNKISILWVDVVLN